MVEFEKSSSTASDAWAQALLARNLLGAGNLVEAQSAAQKAMALSRQSTVRRYGFEAVLADARVKAKLGKLAEAREELESMITSARRFGHRPYEYQARLALGEIELWSGSASAVARLTALERDARAQGFLLVANQADALSQVR
jgi:tetratricopeptide (TPR) repeat protein